jgi:hypothetical protein
MRWAEHVARMAEKRETYKLLAIRSLQITLIRKASQCENNIKNNFPSLDWRDRAGLMWLLMRKIDYLFFLLFSFLFHKYTGNSLNIGVRAGLSRKKKYFKFEIQMAVRFRLRYCGL